MKFFNYMHKSNNGSQNGSIMARKKTKLFVPRVLLVSTSRKILTVTYSMCECECIANYSDDSSILTTRYLHILSWYWYNFGKCLVSFSLKKVIKKNQSLDFFPFSTAPGSSSSTWFVIRSVFKAVFLFRR